MEKSLILILSVLLTLLSGCVNKIFDLDKSEPEKSSRVSTVDNNITPSTESVIFVSDVMCLAQHVYWEARDQPLAGQIAVAQVVVNRANDSKYPNNICDVVYQSEGDSKNRVKLLKGDCEFDWYCDDIPDEATDKKAFEWGVKVARAVKDGKTPDLTDKATHYHLVNKNPTWSNYYKRTIRIEDRIFYKRRNR